VKRTYKKSVTNLIFAGAVATGTILPLGNVFAADGQLTQVLHASFPFKPSIRQDTTMPFDGESKTARMLVTAVAQDSLPSLEEYLSKLVCSGCGRRCPLTMLKCSRGRTYLQKATDDYKTMATKTNVTINGNMQEKPKSLPTAAENPPIAQISARGDKKTGAVETMVEYLPLAGLVVGGVYFFVENRQKKTMSGCFFAEEIQ